MIKLYPPDDNLSCIIPVCHGSQDMHGKRFFAYVSEAAKIYKHCHLVVCDTLDVHNMSPSADLWDEAMTTAKAMGDRWLRKHLSHVQDCFENKVTLARWDDIKADPSFDAKFAEANRLYSESNEVKSWVDGVCSMYANIVAERQRNSGAIPNVQKLFQRSLDYMLEEIAGTSVYHNWYQAPAVYPGQYFDDPELFNRQKPLVDMSVPAQCAVLFVDRGALAA
ncbi:MAG: hypothetical protein WC989_05200 [Micavibrio sp.]